MGRQWARVGYLKKEELRNGFISHSAELKTLTRRGIESNFGLFVGYNQFLFIVINKGIEPFGGLASYNRF